MRIGILTFHEADNFGAVLQAYALRESLIVICASEVSIINYHQKYISSPYMIFPKITASSIMGRIKAYIGVTFRLVNRVNRKRKFSDFRKHYLCVPKNCFNPLLYENAYDVFITGSDQVWNARITHYDSTYFLDFCKYGEKRISYAASIGVDDIKPQEMNFLKNNICFLDFISVREKQSINLIECVCTKKVSHVLDPTLLVPTSHWLSICKNKSPAQYILIYQLAGNDEVGKIAYLLSRRLSIDVKIISDSVRKNDYGFIKEKNLGPLDFLTLLRGATFVVTNSFHGTALSIMLSINFVAIPHRTTGNRIRSLLETLKLEDRIVENSERITRDFPIAIDYTIPNKLLDEEREKSINFLKRAIYGETKPQ